MAISFGVVHVEWDHCHSRLSSRPARQGQRRVTCAQPKLATAPPFTLDALEPATAAKWLSRAVVFSGLGQAMQVELALKNKLDFLGSLCL